MLVRYSQFVEELAAVEELGLADLNTPIVAALEKARATDAELAKKIIPDRVHPGPGGHLLMAGELLKAWQAPALVSLVEIDAKGIRIVQSDNTGVSGLKTDGSVSWSQLDKALPMPIDMNDAVILLAVNSSDFVEALNQQILKVTGLEADEYDLKIDGQPVGSFSKEQLAAGINLAMLETPMVKQAKEVHELTLRHNNIHFQRWRRVQVPLAGEKAPAVRLAVENLMNALDEEEAAVVLEQRAAAKPRAHQFRLVPR